jgi:hypothetical protein
MKTDDRSSSSTRIITKCQLVGTCQRSEIRCYGNQRRNIQVLIILKVDRQILILAEVNFCILNPVQCTVKANPNQRLAFDNVSAGQAVVDKYMMMSGRGGWGGETLSSTTLFKINPTLTERSFNPCIRGG